MQVADLNTLDRTAFVATLSGIFERSPWVAENAIDARPFASVDALHGAMMAAVRGAPASLQLALLRAHPVLAGKAAIGGELTVESTKEQAGAGLDRCSPEELARLTTLNGVYSAKFGFPFILAVKGHDRAGILRELARRIEHDRNTEHDEGLAQIGRITRFRLDALFGVG
jgi:2-oxo-4-hydroxy-4-carboxy-5-ureidoimidazoline decarboxylase